MIETLGDLVVKELEPRDYLVKGLIARKDFVIMSGPQKSGKSIISLNLAIQLALGKEWLGFEVEKKIRVGVVQQEIPEESLKDRVIKMVSKYSNLDFLQSIPHLTRTGIKIGDPKGDEILRGWLEEAKVDLIIVDPLYQFHTGKENDSGDMGAFCQRLQAVGDKFNCGVLLIHHHGKTGAVAREGGDLHRGASVLRDATDGNWTFTRTKKKGKDGKWADVMRLAFEQRHAEAPEPLLLQLNSATLWLEEWKEGGE